MVLISGLRGEGKRAQGIHDGRGMMVVTSYFSPLFLSFPFSCISIFFFFHLFRFFTFTSCLHFLQHFLYHVEFSFSTLLLYSYLSHFYLYLPVFFLSLITFLLESCHVYLGNYRLEVGRSEIHLYH